MNSLLKALKSAAAFLWDLLHAGDYDTHHCMGSPPCVPGACQSNGSSSGLLLSAACPVKTQSAPQALPCCIAWRCPDCQVQLLSAAQVMEVFQEMVWKGCERSVITYSSLISACEKAGQWELALELFNEMHTEGCVPNTVTFNSLISACAQGWCGIKGLFRDQGFNEGSGVVSTSNGI